MSLKETNIYLLIEMALIDDFFFVLVSFILGCGGAWIIFQLGRVLGLLDKSNVRSSHEGVVPKGGGIGIVAAFIFVSLFLKIPSTFWVPSTLLAIFSLIGDRFEISPKYRLPIQFIAALIFVLLSGFNLQLSVFSFLLTVFFALFIVATANWYNFMDGIDGIAGITGTIGFSLLAIFNLLLGEDGCFSVLSICIALSCLGFLPFNFPNAKVFMGDVGSILLGFVFAAIVVMMSKSFFDFVCLAGFLFPFYADEFVTMAVRLKDGENLFKAHRRHLYQLLANEMNIAHWKVTLSYGVFQLIVGLGVLLARPFGIVPVFSLLLLFFIGFIYANHIIRKKIST